MLPIIGKADILQGNRTVFGLLGNFWLGQRLQVQYAVNAVQCIVYDHGIFALEHHLSQGQGDHRRNDDVKQQIQQKGRRNSAIMRQQKACGDQKANTLLTAVVYAIIGSRSSLVYAITQTSYRSMISLNFRKENTVWLKVFTTGILHTYSTA